MAVQGAVDRWDGRQLRVLVSWGAGFIGSNVVNRLVNVVGTLNVLEAAKALRAKRIVFASSPAVYGTLVRSRLEITKRTSPIFF
jgi:nucleoside-diphosphate-sugar epimerase